MSCAFMQQRVSRSQRAAQAQESKAFLQLSTRHLWEGVSNARGPSCTHARTRGAMNTLRLSESGHMAVVSLARHQYIQHGCCMERHKPSTFYTYRQKGSEKLVKYTRSPRTTFTAYGAWFGIMRTRGRRSRVWMDGITRLRDKEVQGIS